MEAARPKLPEPGAALEPSTEKWSRRGGRLPPKKQFWFEKFRWLEMVISQGGTRRPIVVRRNLKNGFSMPTCTGRRA